MADPDRSLLFGGIASVTLSAREAEARSDRLRQVSKRINSAVFGAAVELRNAHWSSNPRALQDCRVRRMRAGRVAGLTTDSRAPALPAVSHRACPWPTPVRCALDRVRGQAATTIWSCTTISKTPSISTSTPSPSP